MRTIWFVYPYGSIPGEATQEMRYIRFGKRLSRKYKCVWWTSNFNKRNKVFRSHGIEERFVQDNLKVVLIPSISYFRNISLKRIAFEVLFVQNLKNAWRKEKNPDLIITPGTGMLTAFRPVWPYIKDKDIKAVFDIMDIHLIKSYFKKRYALLYPLISLLMLLNGFREKGFYHRVAGVIGLGKGQLEIAKYRTGFRNIPSCLIYNGIYVDEFRKKMRQKCPVYLPEKKDGWVWCIYAGSLGPSYDIPAVIKCAKKCEENGNKILFIVAGSGDFSEICKGVKSDNFIYIGYVDKSLLPPLYAKCDIGLCTYSNFSTVDMPDKFYDYSAAGLAIVNSLTGEVKDHIITNNLGVQYKAGDAEDLYEKVCLFENQELGA